MLSRLIAEQALAAALKTGGDFAEIFYEDTRSSSLTLNAGAIETALTGRSAGAGVRVYKGLSSVYVFTNDVSLSGLVRAAQKAADAIGSADRTVDVRLTGAIPRNIHAIAQLPMDVPGARRARVVKAADAAARAVSAEVSQVTARLYDWETDVVIANSEGLLAPDRRVYTRLALTAVASAGGESQTGSCNPGAMMGFELFDGRVDPEEVGRRAAKQAVTMLHAEPCPAGVMCAVIDKGFGGVIFHEACGHSLEATAVAFGNSEFAGKLGQQIASPIVTAIDDGTMENEWGSINIDDEGTPATRLVLIENGVLKNYMVDRLNGRRMAMAVTGSARRQDYTCAPTSRMRNTFIAPGNDDEGEIISSMGDGLYAKAMGGGSVNPITGEFNFAVSEGYLVKGGRIDRPVRGATLIGKGADILKKIDRVGKTLELGQGMCSSVSGSIPVNVGQPMIRVTDITVGGR
ncbi:MAG TPA: TldD/PmbA family protein [Candidatus Pullichristensenella stercoripullorum]|nr:TldD/PmbA family protein [Candidatus Pullichristensenella stercoripullorum]